MSGDREHRNLEGLVYERPSDYVNEEKSLMPGLYPLRTYLSFTSDIIAYSNGYVETRTACLAFVLTRLSS